MSSSPLGTPATAGLGAGARRKRSDASERPEDESNWLGEFEWRATGMTCPVIRESGGAGQVALMSMENEGGGARLFRRFAVFDATTLENRQESRLAGRACRVLLRPARHARHPGLARPAPGAGERLVVWDVAGNLPRERYEVVLPGHGAYYYYYVCHAVAGVVLFLAIPSHASKIVAGQPPPDFQVDKTRRDEIVAYDIARKAVVARSRTDQSGSIDVSDDGKYAIVLGAGQIALRSVPSLRLLHTLKHDAYVTCFAVSDDGQHVAFAGETLTLWDTTTDKVQTLDRLNERLMDPSRIDALGLAVWDQVLCGVCAVRRPAPGARGGNTRRQVLAMGPADQALPFPGADRPRLSPRRGREIKGKRCQEPFFIGHQLRLHGKRGQRRLHDLQRLRHDRHARRQSEPALGDRR